jgi:general secretion pathway protein K
MTPIIFTHKTTLKKHRSQRGAALILALLIVAITAAIASELMVSSQNQIQSLLLRQDAEQAYLDMTYVPLWIKWQAGNINTNLLQNKKAPSWPQIMPQQTFTNGDILNMQFIPANSRFNINNLAMPLSPYFQVFVNLLLTLNPQMSPDTAKQLTLDIQNWMLPGPNDERYAKLIPAYQVPHLQMASISELRLVIGIDTALYQQLMPYIIAIPNSNVPIDINTAELPLLTALLNRNTAAASSVIEYRRMQGSFLTTAEFMGLQQIASQTLDNPNLSNLISAGLPQYILAQADVTRDNRSFHREWLLQYAPQNKQMTTLSEGQTL